MESTCGAHIHVVVQKRGKGSAGEKDGGAEEVGSPHSSSTEGEDGDKLQDEEQAEDGEGHAHHQHTGEKGRAGGKGKVAKKAQAGKHGDAAVRKQRQKEQTHKFLLKLPPTKQPGMDDDELGAHWFDQVGGSLLALSKAFLCDAGLC